MVYLDKNLKKIRGWNRRIKQLDAWQKQNEIPNLTHFDERNEVYVKIWLSPWYRLVKRQPPMWFQRQILMRMLNVMSSWRRHFETHNQPFDLQIWLFQPNFIISEIVCARVRAWGEKRDNYFENDGENKPFPHVLFLNEALKTMTWDSRFFENTLRKKEDDLDNDFIKTLIKKGWREEIILQNTVNEDVMYSLKNADVWVGR